MPKLPAYVFRRANGSYRYKRNVPKKLVGLIGKATLYRQLGESYAEAMRNLPQVHNEIDKLFRMKRMCRLVNEPWQLSEGLWEVMWRSRC